ncbi:Transient receptor potential cation channel subfamily M member 6 [Exaiptasia diaphana]|nr:Transient receptor potential cation channel subfamily M member 6 [Exaiptasia diaphana]
MSKRGGKFNNFKAKVAKKRAGKDEAVGGVMEYITVQRLASHVEGRYQKYARIGALTMVPLACEPTLSNIKEACKRYFKCEDMDCDIVAGERGPSWTETCQISNFKTIHVRFIERESASESVSAEYTVPGRASKQRDHTFSVPNQPSPSKEPVPSRVAASVPLSSMLKLGKLIQSTTEIASVEMEEFDLAKKAWREPFQATFSLAKEKFSTGSFREAYLAKALTSLAPGKYVLKKWKEDQVKEIEKYFKDIGDHTRKAVQMNSLSRNFALSLSAEAPPDFGKTLTYTKVYLGKLYGEYVTIEKYLEGTFSKHVNNTGKVCGDGSEVSLKAEAFSHYTYQKSREQLMVLDVQGVGFDLCDPEIATTDILDPKGDYILFCCGNLGKTAITEFKKEHICNKYCEMLSLDEMETEPEEKQYDSNCINGHIENLEYTYVLGYFYWYLLPEA